MSKEALLDEIDRRAEEQAQNIVASAKSSAKERLDKAEEELAAEHNCKMDRFNSEIRRSVMGQKTLFDIDRKKVELDAKRELIDKVYAMAKQKLLAMTDAEYLKFITKLIAKFAEDGDEVIICARDEKRITAAWVSDRGYDLQISLKLSNERHNDAGGIILRSKKFDKNLTVGSMLNEAEDGTESYVAKRLFE